MARKVDPAKVKAAKQKKIAIGLSVLFVLVLAYQVPKTLKMLKGPSAVAATPAPETAPAPAAPATPGAASSATPGTAAPSAGAPVAAGEAQPAVLVDSDLAIEPADGQLLSFEQFAANDPFEQQVDPMAVAAASKGADEITAPTAAGAAGTTKPDTPATSTGGTVVPGSGSSTGSGAAPGAAPATPQPAAATTISLNGDEVTFAADGSFPADNPVFVLVKDGKDGKSVEIGIAGGAYAGGDKTITLKLGKPLTLQNTADGTRFELELLTVKGFAPPKG
jgi:hypothetical protein